MNAYKKRQRYDILFIKRNKLTLAGCVLSIKSELFYGAECK